MLEVILPQIHQINKHYIIIANGQFPKNSYLLKLIHQASNIICCDGAISHLLKHSINPDHIIGDCDSLSTEVKQYFADKIIEIADQNTNDLTKAVNFAKQQFEQQQIIILGATGLREDHTIANIALLSEYIKVFNDIAIISEHGIFTAHNQATTLKTIPGQQISLFTLNPETIINCTELKWPLKNFTANAWYLGTLNQAIDQALNLDITGTTIVFRSFETKI